MGEHSKDCVAKKGRGKSKCPSLDSENRDKFLDELYWALTNVSGKSSPGIYGVYYLVT
jgi:hypothetical protein